MKIIAILALLAAIAALSMIALAGPAYRLNWLELGQSFMLFRWALYAGGAAALLGLVVLFPSGNRFSGMLALVLGLSAAAVPLLMRQQAQQVPPIHDITTDLDTPPAFVDIIALRADAPNPADYAGEETAQQQREAYADLAAQAFAQEPAAVIAYAEQAARDMGLEIVAVEPQQGRLEAFATTTFFGFVDDVVVRARATGDGTTVDIRSKSRVGRSDLGVNYQRIVELQTRMRELADR